MSLSDYRSITFNGLYTNLLREFIAHGDEVYILSPVERRNGYDGSELIHEYRSTIVKFYIGNIQKTNIIEKGINTILIDNKFISAIKKNLSNIKFDLIIYPTPPITLLKAVEYIKKRDDAKTYLLLKDIFPQNAVDIGVMKTTGLKGIIYRYFRRKEKNLYAVSDRIGCMSQANVLYLTKHNSEIDSKKVEVCPNTTEPVDMSVNSTVREQIRKKYGIPLNKMVFVYGGNLGRPQGIPFLIECLRSQMDNQNIIFLIIGSGTEYSKIDAFIKSEKPKNVKLLQQLPKNDYDQMVGSCDVGLIFLDHRFTIPNFPSRLLAYTMAKIPILAVTDPNTDVGKIIVDGGFGWWCESNSVNRFGEKVREAICADRKRMGECGFSYTVKNYSSEMGYKIITKHIEKWNQG